MIITSEDLRKDFETKWPILRQVWLRNKIYITPPLQELKDVIKLYPIDHPIIPGFNECENFALFLHYKVKKHRVKLYEQGKLKADELYNWAFGDFICKKNIWFQGPIPHSACVCRCEEGFYFIEPMEQNIVVEPSSDYEPFFFVNLN